MSITYTADVFCDGEGCSRWTHGATANNTTGLARHSRHNVKREKWAHVIAPSGKHMDLCPTCLAKWEIRWGNRLGKKWENQHALQREVQQPKVPSPEGTEQAPLRLQDLTRLR